MSVPRLCSVFLSALIFPALSAAQTDVTYSLPQFVGTAALANLPAATATAFAPPRIYPPRNLKDARRAAASSFSLALANSASQPLSVPAPTDNEVLGGKPLVGFAGLNTVDSITANGCTAANASSCVLSPPDQGLCVGNGFVVETVNLAISIYNTKGTLLHEPKSLNAFFNVSFADSYFTDPRCYFDRPTQRWFISVDNSITYSTGRANFYLAVSQTSDPTGSYFLYSVDTTNDGLNGTPNNPWCPCFGDQPLIGADANGFYVSTFEIPRTPNPQALNGQQLYALSKTMLEEGVSPTVVHFNLYGNSLAEGFAYWVQPASSSNFDDEPSIGVEYFVSALDFTNTLDDRIAVWAMSNTRSLSEVRPDVALTYVIVPTEVYGYPYGHNGATQKAGPYPLGMSFGDAEETLDTLADWTHQTVFANGQLWSGLNTIVSDGINRNVGIAYFVIRPEFKDGVLSATLVGQNYISVKGNFVWNPSIGVTEDGTAVMAFSLSGPDYFPTAAYAHIAPHPSGPVRIAAAGKAPQDDSTGYPQFFPPSGFCAASGCARWGDYTAAVADGTSIWLGGEYIPGGIDSTVYFTNWGTFVYKVNADN